MSDLSDWIETLFEDAESLSAEHAQRTEDLNLGLGWLYYALARVVRPQLIVVIGSRRGFASAVLGKALDDNVEAGDVTFIDPSTDPFVPANAERSAVPVGLLFVGGCRDADQAQSYFDAFSPRLDPRGFALFHDSVVPAVLRRDPAWQIFDFPFGSGLALIRQVVRGQRPLKLGKEYRVRDDRPTD